MRNLRRALPAHAKLLGKRMQISKSASTDAARVQLTGEKKGLRMKVSRFGSQTKSIPAGLVPAVFFYVITTSIVGLDLASEATMRALLPICSRVPVRPTICCGCR